MSNYEKKTLQYKVFATKQLTVFYRDVLKYSTFRVLFFGKKNAGTIDFFVPCKIMHLKTKRKFTLLVASNSDFVSANVILNQHPSY